MAYLNIFSILDYKRLSPNEHEAIQEWLNGEPELLADLINGSNKTPGFKAFCSDLALGKVKRKRGQRKNYFKRDYEIYQAVNDLDIDSSRALTSEIIPIVADQFKMDEAATLKAYQRIKKAHEEYYKELGN